MISSSPAGMPRADTGFVLRGSANASTYSEGPALCPQSYFYSEPIPNCFYSTAAGNEPFGRGVGHTPYSLWSLSTALEHVRCDVLEDRAVQDTHGGSDTLISIPQFPQKVNQGHGAERLHQCTLMETMYRWRSVTHTFFPQQNWMLSFVLA
jgi:hypothetical protein